MDTRQDTIQRVVDLGNDLASEGAPGYFDITKMKRGGLSLVFMTSCVDYRYLVAGIGQERPKQLIDSITAFVQSNRDDLFLIRSLDDLDLLPTSGRIDIMISIEGSQALRSELDVIDEVFNEGVRSVGLTHFTFDDWADASTDRLVNGGISGVGRDAIARYNDLGIMIDLSHSSDDAFWQTLEVSKAPHSIPTPAAEALLTYRGMRPTRFSRRLRKAEVSSG